MNKFVSIAILIIVSSFLSSCFIGRKASHKGTAGNDTAVAADTNNKLKALPPQTNAVQNNPVQPTVKPTIPDTLGLAPATNTDSEKALISRLEPLWKNRLAYKTFGGKARVKFDGPDNKQEFAAIFRVRKDSIIWINVIAIGLPVARIMITKDSLFMINYMQEEVTFRALNDVAKLLPTKVDFSSLQNLLTGEPFREGQITSADTAGNAWELKVEDSSYIQDVTYNKTDSTIRSNKLLTRKAGGPEATEIYSNYEPTSKGKISTDRELTIKNGADNYFLKMVLVKFDFDEDFDFPFPSVPKNYTVK